MPKHQYYLPSRKLVSQDDAALIQNARVPRSRFQNHYNHLTTFGAAYLIPFLAEEILPGDHVRYNLMAYVRMATALFPLMSNQRLDTFFFFVPNRLVWDNWERFMGQQDNPGDSINYTVPVVVSPVDGFQPTTLWDYMNVGALVGQITAGQTVDIQNLPARGYNLIWNTWFRDQNVQNSVPVPKGNGPDNVGDFGVRRRNKSHDYFTSALPWPQKFTPLQTLFTGTAPVIGIGVQDGALTGAAGAFRETDNVIKNYPGYLATNSAGTLAAIRADVNAAFSATNPPRIYADLAQATGVTINALRQAWLVQDLLERDARGGTRYIELIRSHFGVVNPDFRLQRPEYIGGGQTPINITPIAQTATGGGGLGALGGVGTAAGQHTASYAATEHGYIIGLINIRTELAYQQGIPRHWSKQTRYDYYFPALAGLGEQAIYRQEIYVTGDNALDGLVFGYQERWHEYRTEHSKVSGLFRSTTAGNIDEWHLAQQFSAAPTLSDAFLREEPPMARVLAAGAAANGMEYLADIAIERTITRPVPMYGTPATLSRF